MSHNNLINDQTLFEIAYTKSDLFDNIYSIAGQEAGAEREDIMQTHITTMLMHMTVRSPIMQPIIVQIIVVQQRIHHVTNHHHTEIHH